jgi:hypothetical protein
MAPKKKQTSQVNKRPLVERLRVKSEGSAARKKMKKLLEEQRLRAKKRAQKYRAKKGADSGLRKKYGGIVGRSNK